MTSSDLLELDITGIAHGGTFIARHEGRVVFVSDAVPGERVRVRLDPASVGAGSKSFWRAETVTVLEPSPHRTPHIWAEAGIGRDPSERPGGAELGHIELGHQRSLKRQVLAEALERFGGGGLEAPEVEGVDDSDGTGWRTRVSLHVDDDGRVGPYAARSHRVVEVADHPLAVPGIRSAVVGLAGEPGRIDLVRSGDGEIHVRRLPESGRRPRSRVIREHVGDRTFRVDDDGFWQVHPRAASVLDAAVRDLIDGRVDPARTHYDLYGGVGLFASALADLGAADLVTVESNPQATRHAVQNLAPLDVTAVTARVDRFLAGRDARSGTGVVVLDPPRSGAGRGVVEALDGMRPDAVVYVACDPVALARDLGTFRERGWRPTRMRAFDLFPHTHHFETVALLER